MPSPFVVASHPSHQGFFYRVPLAAQSCGLPGVFLTGLYYKPNKPWWRFAARLPRLGAGLPRRREPALADSRVVSPAGPLPEALRLLAPSYTAANGLHDRCAARWLRRHRGRIPGPVVVHGAIGSCRELFRAGNDLGASCVLEVTSPPGGDRIAVEAAAAWDLPVPRPPAQAREAEEIARADVLLVQNRFSARLLQEAGVEPARIRLLPLGADLQRFRPRAGGPEGGAEHARRPGPLRVLFVGRLTPAKGLPLLLEAWRRLAPRDADLLLAGPLVDSAGPRMLERYAGCFTHLGRLSQAELAAAYADADVFVMPSLFEGGPLVVLEAMASGLPCLVSTAAASIVEDGVSGLIVPTGDLDALMAGLERLLGDAALRRDLGAAARSAVAAFGWEQHAARLCRVYRSLAAGEAVPELVELAPLPAEAHRP